MVLGVPAVAEQCDGQPGGGEGGLGVAVDPGEAPRVGRGVGGRGVGEQFHPGPDSPEALDASFVADLRRSAGRYPDDPRLHRLVERLSERSEQFRELWRRPEVAEHGPTVKRITHSEVGLLELDCDILRTHRGDLRIVTYSAEPGSPSDSKLALLAAIGTQRPRAGAAD
ncbi:MmyB family transcriptional regulator [Streptomyces koyangensis]